MRAPLVLASLLAAVLMAPPAWAHGDAPREAGTATIDPGETISWTREIHWHRLVGTVDATAPVTVAVEGPASEDPSSEGSRIVAGPGSELVVNHLITCCRDATWTPHTVRITNPGQEAVEVSFDLVLLHDNLAVVSHDAETGAWWQALATVGAVIAISAWRARQPTDGGSPDRWLRASRLLHAAAWGLSILLAAIGWARFGGGPLTASLGATAFAPMDGGFFNTHAFVLLALMVLWGAAVACWAGARRRAGSPRAYRWDRLVFAAGSVLVGVLMGIEFGGWPISLTVGLVPAAALVVDGFGWLGGQRPTR